MITARLLIPPQTYRDKFAAEPDPAHYCRYCDEFMNPENESPDYERTCRTCAKRLCVHCGRRLAANEPEHPDQEAVCLRCARLAYPKLRRCGFAAVTAWLFACGRSEPPIRLQPWWTARGLGGAP